MAKPGTRSVEKGQRPGAAGERRATASSTSAGAAPANAPRGQGRDSGGRTPGARTSTIKRTGTVAPESGARAPGTVAGNGKRANGTANDRGARAPRTEASSGKRADSAGSDRGARASRSEAGIGKRPGSAATERGVRTPRTAADTGKRTGSSAQARPERKSAAPVKRQPMERAERPERDGRPERRPSGVAAARSAADPETAGTVRLSKRMSELGLCSRREADEWIENGWVRVDGERIDTLGARVRPDQKIEVTRDAHAAQARQVTILLHKPVGYVSGQAEDGYEPAVTLVTAENRWDGDRSPQRFSASHLRTLAPAGRLDIDSTGLLVLTQDGRIAKQLIGEHSGVEKEYLVRVTYGEHTTDIDRHFPADKLALLRFGLSLDGAALKPAKVSWQNGEQLRFALREGKKRQIRRMCELVGLHVVGLKRVRMGRVMLGALPPGKWRYLLADEAF